VPGGSGVGKGMTELREALSKIDQVQWSHGYRGGKPMMPNKRSVQLADQSTCTDSLLRDGTHKDI
jgi:hypothetical protein